tara:strand:+ start:836 stop:1255 length:420 start_codon:yes stop_codon:yes gene_type:complete
MVDIVGLYSGIRPFANSRESTFFDLATSGGQFENKNNNIREPALRIYDKVNKTPSEFNKILNIDTLRGVLPLKAEPEAVRYGRPDTSLTEHMYPKTGYARFQPKGLATNHNKPMDTVIPPISGFYNQDAPNVLGGLKGS